jgi:hypothetical protein
LRPRRECSSSSAEAPAAGPATPRSVSPQPDRGLASKRRRCDLSPDDVTSVIDGAHGEL